MSWNGPTRERRVLKAGHSSIAVTLPKPWAEAMHLRPGDLVVFDQNEDGTLFLKPATGATNPKASPPFHVQASQFPDPGQLERLVAGAYRTGHDSIEIHSETPLNSDRVEEVHAAARRLLGLSVVAHEPTRLVLQSFIDPSKYELPQLVQRMKMILMALVDEARKANEKGSVTRRRLSLAEETDKVHALLVRQLELASRDWSLARQIGSPDPRQLLAWRVVVQGLEELGNLLEDLPPTCAQGPRSHRSDLDRTLAEFQEALEAVVSALVHPSLSGASEAYELSEDLVHRLEDLSRPRTASVNRTPSASLPSLPTLGRAADKLLGLAMVASDRSMVRVSTHKA